MRSRHSPVIAPARGFFGPGERRTDHDGISAAGKCLANVTSGGHPAVSDDRNIAFRLLVICVPSGRAIDGGGNLRDSYAENASCRTRGPRPYPYEKAAAACAHKLKSDLVSDAV